MVACLAYYHNHDIIVYVQWVRVQTRCDIVGEDACKLTADQVT